MGNQKNYHLFVLGCQQNVLDGGKIDQILTKLGLNKTEEKSADLVIILACSVRQSAVNRIWGRLMRWQNKKVLVLACVLPSDKKKLAERVDLIIDTEAFLKSPRKYLEQLGLKLNSQHSDNKFASIRIMPRSGFVNIQLGCDNFCAYCAVPYTRGREKSLSPKVILNEVKNLARQGVGDITLLGENVNSYGKNDHSLSSPTTIGDLNQDSRLRGNDIKTPFVKLLEKIELIEDVQSINFLTSNPQDFDDGLIEWLKNSKKWNHGLHLALQSGDDEILKKMNRKYGSKQFLRLVEKIDASLSSRPPRLRSGQAPRRDPLTLERDSSVTLGMTGRNFKLSTDIIVGFPTETERQFENTVKLCKKIGFFKAYISQYSPRQGTVAHKLYKDDIPATEKKRRWEVLDRLIHGK